jgi:hypothetical protein
LIRELLAYAGPWPRAFVQGLALECFVNERGELRCKARHLSTVLEIVQRHPDARRILEEVSHKLGCPIQRRRGRRRREIMTLRWMQLRAQAGRLAHCRSENHFDSSLTLCSTRIVVRSTTGNVVLSGLDLPPGRCVVPPVSHPMAVSEARHGIGCNSVGCSDLASRGR